MAKSEKYDYRGPLGIPEQELADFGECVGFFRIVLGAGGLASDGHFPPDKLPLAIAVVLLENQELEKAFDLGAQLFKMTKGNVLAEAILKSKLISNEHGECTCPKCVVKREMENKAKDN